MSKGSDSSYWLGFDLGGTKMLATVYNAKFEAAGRSRIKTKGMEGQEQGLQRIKKNIREALEAASVSAKQLSGIGIGCPGPLDLDQGILLDTPNLGWKNMPLAKNLSKEFGCPAFILNDVDAGVFGEYAFGAARGSYCAVGLFPGTGIGGGCVYDGKLLRGKVNSCMEVGHIQVQPDGPLCGCGRYGCLEAVASRLAISAQMAAAAYRGEAPTIMSRAGFDLSNIRSGVIASAVEAGDETVIRLVKDAAKWLGVGVATIVNLLAPDRVVLGGGLVEAMPDLILKEVEKQARKRVHPSYEKVFKVVEAELGDDAAVKGAAAWARKMATGEGPETL